MNGWMEPRDNAQMWVGVKPSNSAQRWVGQRKAVTQEGGFTCTYSPRKKALCIVHCLCVCDCMQTVTMSTEHQHKHQTLPAFSEVSQMILYLFPHTISKTLLVLNSEGAYTLKNSWATVKKSESAWMVIVAMEAIELNSLSFYRTDNS